MKTLIRLAAVSLLMIMAAPAFAGSALQVYACQQDDSATEDKLAEVASAWKAAANKMPGGENIEVYLNFPVAATMGEDDFMFVVIAPSFAEWGTFMDGYDGSPASKVDHKMGDLADCPDSSLWESETVK
jgi:hypothetical protein